MDTTTYRMLAELTLAERMRAAERQRLARSVRPPAGRPAWSRLPRGAGRLLGRRRAAAAAAADAAA